MAVNNPVYLAVKRRVPWDLWSLMPSGKPVQEVSSGTPLLFSSYFPRKAAFQPDRKKSQAKLVDSTPLVLKSSQCS